jgi:hypothetical protein
MSLKLSQLFTSAEYSEIGNDLVAKGLYRNDPSFWKPGMGHLADWYYDPSGEREAAGKHVVAKRDCDSFLSRFYWDDWSDKRPPIIVICPNGRQWCVDQKSSNGEGWKVTGEWPNITCTPSIVVPGYHGFLQNGIFTDDLEGRGPNGVAE